MIPPPPISNRNWAKPLTLKMRADLAAVRQSAGEHFRWLIKDPISLRYFELSDEEYAVLKILNGRVTLVEIKEAIERQFPPRIATWEQLQSLLHRFFELGLVYGDGPAQTAAAEKARRSQNQNKWFGQLMSPLFIKLPGFDPEPILRWLYPRVRWAFSPITVAFCLVLVATAAILVAVEFETISLRLPSLEQLFQAGNFIWLVAAIAISKALHEFGHALTCKHYGGECHEIGPAFLVFAPSLYCDTTDAWMFPNKWHRAAVGAAGMAVELLLASVCVIVWYFSQPGLLQFLCLNTILVCSVSTLMFNGNPLLRFDGYYILSDLLGLSNLAQTSRSALLRLLRVVMLGLPGPAIAKSSHSPGLLLGYAIASLIYRWALALGILVMLSRFLRPYGLQSIGNTFLALTLFGMFVLPCWKLFQFFSRPGIWRRLRFARAAASSALVVLVVAAILYIPVPHHVLAPLVLEHRNADRVYVTVPGILEAVFVQPGDRVAPGVPVAKLTNLEIAQEIARLSGERDRLQMHLQNLMRRQGHDEDAADAIPITRISLADLEERLRQQRLDEKRLELVADHAGVISPPPHLPSPPANEKQLPMWSGLPCEPANLGCYLDVGTLVSLVAEPDKMDALLIVNQSEIEFVRPLQEVEIRLNEYRAETLVGKIAQVAQIDLETVPLVLSHKSGGELSTVTDKSGAERPMHVAYQARVPIPETTFPLLSGFHGRAKIDVGSEPLGRRILRFLRQTFLF